MKKTIFTILILLLLPLTVKAQAVTSIIGASLNGTPREGVCGTFAFSQAPTLTLNVGENEGASLDVSKNGQTWYAMTGQAGPNSRYIVYGQNGSSLIRTNSTLLFTGATSDPTTAMLIKTTPTGTSQVAMGFSATGCGAVTGCIRYFRFSSSLAALGNNVEGDFNTSTNTPGRIASLGNSMYLVHNTSTGGAGVLLRHVSMTDGTALATARKEASLPSLPANIFALQETSSLQRLYLANGGNHTIYRFASDLTLFGTLTLAGTPAPGRLTASPDALFVTLIAGPARMCKINLSTFNATSCNNTYSYTGSDGSVTSALFVDNVNNKLYELRNDAAQDTVLLRYTMNPFAFDTRVAVSPTSPSNLGTSSESYSFSVPEQRLTWIGQPGSPAQINSINVCSNILR